MCRRQWCGHESHRTKIWACNWQKLACFGSRFIKQMGGWCTHLLQLDRRDGLDVDAHTLASKSHSVVQLSRSGSSLEFTKNMPFLVTANASVQSTTNFVRASSIFRVLIYTAIISIYRFMETSWINCLCINLIIHRYNISLNLRKLVELFG